MDEQKKKSQKKRSVIPIYAIGAVWLLYAGITSTNTLAKIRFFILYSPLHLFSPQQDHQTLFLLQFLQKKKSGIPLLAFLGITL